MVVGKVTVFLIAAVKDTVLEDVNVKVSSTLEVVEIVTWLVEA